MGRASARLLLVSGAGIRGVVRQRAALAGAMLCVPARVSRPGALPRQAGKASVADSQLQGDLLSKAKSRANPLPGVPWYHGLLARSAIHGGAFFSRSTATAYWSCSAPGCGRALPEMPFSAERSAGHASKKMVSDHHRHQRKGDPYLEHHQCQSRPQRRADPGVLWREPQRPLWPHRNARIKIALECTPADVKPQALSTGAPVRCGENSGDNGG